MGFRERRQLAVVAVAAVLAAGAGFFIFRANLPEPSCRDNRKNQGEEKVDCGGPCVPCAFREQKPLEVFWVRFVKTRENAYDAAAEVRNPNAKLGAGSFKYEFKIFDAAGAAVAKREGESFIYPGETMHIAEVGLLSGRAVKSASLVIRDTAWVLSEEIAPDIIAGGKEYTEEEENGFRRGAVKALISNRAVRDIGRVSVSAFAFDAENNLLGAHRTILDELPAGQARPVKFTWPAAFGKPVSSIIIEARSPAALAPAGP